MVLRNMYDVGAITDQNDSSGKTQEDATWAQARKKCDDPSSGKIMETPGNPAPKKLLSTEAFSYNTRFSKRKINI